MYVTYIDPDSSSEDPLRDFFRLFEKKNDLKSVRDFFVLDLVSAELGVIFEKEPKRKRKKKGRQRMAGIFRK